MLHLFPEEDTKFEEEQCLEGVPGDYSVGDRRHSDFLISAIFANLIQRFN